MNKLRYFGPQAGMSLPRGSRSGFLGALSLHLLVFLVAVVMWWVKQRTPERPHVFELMPPPESWASAPDPAPEPTPTPPPPTPIQVPPAPPLPDQFRLPTPAPAPPTPPPPTPTPPRETTRPAPTPQPPPPKPEPPPLISQDEFQRRHGRPNTPTPTAKPRPTVVPVPSIDTSAINKALSDLQRDNADRISRMSQAEQNQMDRYFSALYQRLDREFTQSVGASGRNLEATVRFTIEADGRITRAQIIRSSGQPAFDQAVRDLFLRVRQFEPPPDRKAWNPTLIFRLSD